MPRFFRKFSRTIYPTKTINFLLAVVMLSSCTSIKSLNYFQKEHIADTKFYATLATSNPIPLRIQSDDVLAVVVSSLSEESNALINNLNASTIPTPRFSSAGSGGSQPLGYLVDVDGDVNLPLVGKVRLAGMTLDEADIFVTQQLSRYIKDPTVNVRILNHKFTVFGEVVRPGIYNLSDNPTTLPEVIGLAGDLTIYGRRDNIMLIRTINNKREVVRLDLTSLQVFNSPYYFIENNDVVYVESRPGKVTSSDRTVQLIPVFLSITTGILLLVNFVIK